MQKEHTETQESQNNQENLKTISTRGKDGRRVEVVVRIIPNQPGEVVEVRSLETQP